MPAFEHKQVLVGRRQWLKLQLIVCTNHGPRKNRFKTPSSLTFLLAFCYKNYCNFLLLVRARGRRLFLLQLYQLPAPGQCKMYLSFLLPPDEPQFYPLCARRVTDPLRLVTPLLVSDSVQGFVSYIGFGIQIPTRNYIINFMGWVESGYSCSTNRELHKRNSDFSRLCRKPMAQLKGLTSADPSQYVSEMFILLPTPRPFLRIFCSCILSFSPEVTQPVPVYLSWYQTLLEPISILTNLMKLEEP